MSIKQKITAPPPVGRVRLNVVDCPISALFFAAENRTDRKAVVWPYPQFQSKFTAAETGRNISLQNMVLILRPCLVIKKLDRARVRQNHCRANGQTGRHE